MIFNDKTLVIDLDDTICKKTDTYDNALVNYELVSKIREYKDLGFDIIIYTARNMKTYSGDHSKIQLNTIPSIADWLKRNEIPCDGLITGKPWCGTKGFYIDNRAIRPSEFVAKSIDEIRELIENENHNTFS